MFNDLDFEVTTNIISEKVVVIRDPQLVLIIEKWVNKLTNSEHRGTNELNYLKLLQYMMVNKQIGPPFTRAPPAGQLYPLSRYLNPPPCNRRWTTTAATTTRNRGRSTTNSWHMVTCSRSAQTDEEEDNDVDYEYEEQTDEKYFYKSGRNEDVKSSDITTAATTTGNDDDKNNGGESTGDEVQQPIVADDNKAESRTEDVEKRDEHLKAGGGKEYSVCSRSKGPSHQNWRKVANENANAIVKLCNPCLDGYLKKFRPAPEPIDEAYADLLGDCTLPTLTKAEQKTVGPELSRVLENVNDDTTLQEFYFQVGLNTCDDAALMIRVGDGMIDDFREFAMNVFESRLELISDGLAKDQIHLSVTFEYLRHRMLNRATTALDFLRDNLPTFTWNNYQTEPESYMKREVLRRMSNATLAASASGDVLQSCASRGPDNATSDRNDNDGADEEEEDRARQNAIKKMLYSLNWLRTDMKRGECENKRFIEQHRELTIGLSEITCRMSEAQCQSANEIERLANELTVLKQQSADQTMIIDRIIPMVMSNSAQSQSAPPLGGC